MTEKNRPKIEDAKALAKRDDSDVVVIFYGNKESLSYASYGKNKRWCRIAQGFADMALRIATVDDA